MYIQHTFTLIWHFIWAGWHKTEIWTIHVYIALIYGLRYNFSPSLSWTNATLQIQTLIGFIIIMSLIELPQTLCRYTSKFPKNLTNYHECHVANVNRITMVIMLNRQHTPFSYPYEQLDFLRRQAHLTIFFILRELRFYFKYLYFNWLSCV